MFNPTLQPSSSRLMKSNFYFGSSDAGVGPRHCFPTSGQPPHLSFPPRESYLPVASLPRGRLRAKNFPNGRPRQRVRWSKLGRQLPGWKGELRFSPGYSGRAIHRGPVISPAWNAAGRFVSRGEVFFESTERRSGNVGN